MSGDSLDGLGNSDAAPIQLTLSDSKIFKKVSGNTLLLLTERLVRLGIGLLITVWMARHLGPEDFGLLNYAISITLIGSAIATFGFPEILVRDFVQRSDEYSCVASTALMLRVLSSTGASILCVTFVHVLRPGDTELLVVTAVVSCSLLFQIGDVIELYFQSQQRFGVAVFIRLAAFLVCSATRVVAILSDATVLTFAIISSLETLFVLLAFFGAAIKSKVSLNIDMISYEETKRLVRDSLPIMLRLFAIAIYMRTDQIVIGYYWDDSAVGVYAAAARLSEMAYLIPVCTVLAFSPIIAKDFVTSKELFDRRIQLVTSISVLVAMVYAIALLFLADSLILFLYGADYTDAADIVIVHAWAGVFVALGTSAGPWFINHRLMRFGFYQALIGAIFSIFLNIWLVPIYGPLAAAWSLIISQIITAFVLNAVFPRTRSLFSIQVRAINLLNLKNLDFKQVKDLA